LLLLLNLFYYRSQKKKTTAACLDESNTAATRLGDIAQRKCDLKKPTTIKKLNF